MIGLSTAVLNAAWCDRAGPTTVGNGHITSSVSDHSGSWGCEVHNKPTGADDVYIAESVSQSHVDVVNHIVLKG